jgi:hypothetical protein
MKAMLFPKEVTIMKTYMAIATMVMLTVAFGVAYADEFPIANRDVGTELYFSAFPTHEVVAAKDFTGTGANDTEGIEVGAVLYNDLIIDTMMASSEVEGSAAGGVAKDDERTIIWDNLLGAPGGSDLP